MAILLLNGVGPVCNTTFGELAWIEWRDSVPGGPAAILAEDVAWWVDTLGAAATLVGVLLGDGLLVSVTIVAPS